MKLSDYRNPGQLKGIGSKPLEALAGDIRRFLVGSVSETGGHLASNLGVVELTLALHAVFDSPGDKIIWDVGHQCYAHKILTGRAGLFGGLRKFGGLSGFPKAGESPHDAFNTGHSSTAISAGLGLAAARDLGGLPRESRVIAVVGDGSLTGGLAYEGLNNAGRMKTDFLVVLNDNEMSISPNVGAISTYLSQIRTASNYLGAKRGVHTLLDMLPVVGMPLAKGIESLKSMLKFALLPGTVFEELGFKYVGPVSGHDMRALLTVMRQVRRIKGPVLLHVLTKKGRGYGPAEKRPMQFHGIGPFCPKSGRARRQGRAATFSDAFSAHIVRLAAGNKDIVAITAAMPGGTGLAGFKEAFPERFFDVGIAEGHAVTFAAGLAKGGKKPLVAVYSSFLQRAYDQVLHDVAIQKLPVVLALDRAGAVDGDGETHHGLFDIAYLSHIPGMTILAPSSGAELGQMLAHAFARGGPVAIRYPRDETPDGSGEPDGGADKIESLCLQKGAGTAIVSVGAMLPACRDAAKLLGAYGRRPSLYSARSVKPVCPRLARALLGYERVFTAEDHSVAGGYGAGLCAALNSLAAQTGARRVPLVVPMGFPDEFIETGSRRELFRKHGLGASGIVERINNMAGEN